MVNKLCQPVCLSETYIISHACYFVFSTSWTAVSLFSASSVQLQNYCISPAVVFNVQMKWPSHWLKTFYSSLWSFVCNSSFHFGNAVIPSLCPSLHVISPGTGLPCQLWSMISRHNKVDLGPPFQGSAIPEVRHSGVVIIVVIIVILLYCYTNPNPNPILTLTLTKP